MARARRPWLKDRTNEDVDGLVTEMEKTLDQSKREREEAEKAIQILEARAKAMIAAYWGRTI